MEVLFDAKIKARLDNYNAVCKRDGMIGKLRWREDLPGEDYFSTENMYLDSTASGSNARVCGASLKYSKV